MTLKEVTQELRRNTKVYLGIMPQSTFSQTLRMIENGSAKESTAIKFLAKFGYTVEKERTWKRNS